MTDCIPPNYFAYIMVISATLLLGYILGFSSGYKKGDEEIND